MSASMNYSKRWPMFHINAQDVNFVVNKQDRLAVTSATIGTKTVTRVFNIVNDTWKYLEIDHKKIYFHPFFIILYPFEIKNSQEMLLQWVKYTVNFGDKYFKAEFTSFTLVQLLHHYLIFKNTNNDTVKMVDLNTVQEIVRINYQKVHISITSNDAYVMKFIVKSTNNVESEFLVLSDTVIKSPSHAKITELTEDQYNTMKREKLFKQ